MYHEFMHDIFNVMHVNDKKHLMHPTSQPINQTDLVRMLVDAIKQVKLKKISLFKTKKRQ